MLVVDTLLQTKESYEANDPFGTNALSATTESSGTNEPTEMNEQFQTNSPSDEQMNIGQEHNIEGKGVYDALGFNKQLKKWQRAFPNFASSETKVFHIFECVGVNIEYQYKLIRPVSY